MKPTRLRAQAKRDLSDTAVYYTGQGGAKLGRAFVAAATAALEPLARMPGPGSPRAAALCGVPELRVWGVSGWPVQWFYFERDDILDVVRLLGERQDIAAIFTTEPPAASSSRGQRSLQRSRHPRQAERTCAAPETVRRVSHTD